MRDIFANSESSFFNSPWFRNTKSWAMHWCSYQKISCFIFYACKVYYFDAKGMIKLCDAVFEARCVAWSRCDLHNLRSQGLICISQSEAKHSRVDQSEAADSLLWSSIWAVAGSDQAWPLSPGPAGGCQGCFALLCSDLQTFPGPGLARSEQITGLRLCRVAASPPPLTSHLTRPALGAEYVEIGHQHWSENHKQCHRQDSFLESKNKRRIDCQV